MESKLPYYLDSDRIRKQQALSKIKKVKNQKYPGFNYLRTLTGVTKEVEGEKHFFKFRTTYQKIYKASKKFNTDDLDVVVPQILKTRRVNGVLVVFEVTFDETGETTMVSNYINPQVMVNIMRQKERVFDYVGKKLQLGDTKYRTLRFIYLRIIYEKNISK